MATGDVFGEVSFLLSARRISDVIAASDRVRVLSVSEKTLRRLVDSESRLAAKVLWNLARAVCLKLVERSALQAR
jgi:CRP-like cAMP-binding protein